MNMFRLHAVLGLWLVFCASQANSANAADDSLFAEMLREGIGASDIAAHVEVVAMAPVKTNGVYTRYWIETRVLETYVGAPAERLIFYLWSEEKPDQSLFGERLIVTLVRDPKDGQYYVHDNGYAFPDDEDLRTLARATAAGKRGHAVNVGPAICEPGSYPQPGGAFAVQVYCDDALATNIAVHLARMSAPVEGPYTLTRRSWQGGDWAGDVTSFAWSQDSAALFVATSAVNGTGSVYRLSLLDQQVRQIWRRDPDDCIPKLVNAGDSVLDLEVVTCGGASRAVRIALDETQP